MFLLPFSPATLRGREYRKPTKVGADVDEQRPGSIGPYAAALEYMVEHLCGCQSVPPVSVVSASRGGREAGATSAISEEAGTCHTMAPALSLPTLFPHLPTLEQTLRNAQLYRRLRLHLAADSHHNNAHTPHTHTLLNICKMPSSTAPSAPCGC